MSQLRTDLFFDNQHRLLVDKSDGGLFRLAGLSLSDDAFLEWFSAADRSIHVAVIDSSEVDSGDFRSIGFLFSADCDAELSELLTLIEPRLHELPYLGQGENEYIYRFRTARERNQSVYIDEHSDSLYQSKLCAAIKAARRTKEKKSGEPAELDFGAVRYVIPSHFGFCLGVQNAIERAYETVAANPGKRVFMLSELIHNPFVNEAIYRPTRASRCGRTAVRPMGRTIPRHYGIRSRATIS